MNERENKAAEQLGQAPHAIPKIEYRKKNSK